MDFAVDINSLVTAAAEGSRSSFAELVRLHHQRIRSFLSRFTSDSALVDDLAQEVFLTAYRQLHEFKAESEFSTWLFGIARNKALSFLRSESRRKAREKDVFMASIYEWQAEGLEQESDDQEVRLSWLEECLNDLPERGQRVIQLHYFEGKSSKQVGEHLGKGTGAIRMMLVRIRRALLKCITSKQKR